MLCWTSLRIIESEITNNGCHDEVWNSGATIECLVIQGDSNLSGTSKMVKAERHEKKSLSECGKNLYPKSWYD